MNTIDAPSDAALVAATLKGERAAFGRIVERYQRLLCSVAYSATGQLSQSEDLAQEAFIEAWKQLRTLREPEKLRPWLCSILRFKVSRLRRNDRREPVRHAAELDAAFHLEAESEPAADIAVHKEEQAILWQALAQVPENYREPLILYYREHKSVEHVATALDLTEDTVKQRLARGRKLLQEQVLAFVEGALQRSTPGRVFTVAVLAALPELPTSVKAAAVATAAAHTGALAKTTAVAALLTAVSSVVSTVLTLRVNLDQARTPRERRGVVKITLVLILSILITLAAMVGLRSAAYRWWEQRMVFTAVAQVGGVMFGVGWALGAFRSMRCMRQLRTTERKERPELFAAEVDQVGSSSGEYTSKACLFGVPLGKIRFAVPQGTEGPVVGWIAGGDRAHGLLVAWGAVAIAPFSVGAVSVGLVSIGCVSVGLFSLGTIAAGFLALGSMAYGAHAFSWLSACGWQTAKSAGFAVARVAAEGPIAFAQHANDSVAQQMLTDPNAERNSMIMLAAISVFSVVPIACYARAVRQRFGTAAREARLQAHTRKT